MDRNPLFVFRPPESEVSLSARRAWIEIFLSVFAFGMPTVALRKESVDRNITSRQLPAPKPRRSPQGERG